MLGSRGPRTWAFRRQRELGLPRRSPQEHDALVEIPRLGTRRPPMESTLPTRLRVTARSTSWLWAARSSRLVDLSWEFPVTAAVSRFFAARGRAVLFDRRGIGMSDPVNADDLPPLEVRIEDLHAVMDAAGVDRAVLFGVEEGAAQCLLFGATYPERTAAIIVNGASARGSWAPDAPYAWSTDEWEKWFDKIKADFGTPAFVEEHVRWNFPARAADASFIELFGRLLRHSLSPASALAIERMEMQMDVRQILPTVQAPTLVIHITGDQVEPIEGARDIAARVPVATLIEAPGSDHLWWPGSRDHAQIDARVDAFLASLKDEESVFDRVLATVLFTDIVGSTERAAELGRPLLARAPRPAPRDRAGDARSLPRPGGRHGRRRVLRDLRRAGAGDPVRAGDHGSDALGSGSKSELDFTRGRSRRSAKRSAGSPSISAPASRRWPAHPRCLSPRP